MTFVETLVSSVIGTVLAGMVIVIYMMYDSQARENNAGFTMLMQYDNLSSQIARHAGNAKRVLSTGTFHDTCNITGDTTDTVWFFDGSSALVAGIGIAADTLIERDPSTGTWGPYFAGNGAVLVDTSSRFLLPGCNNSIELDLTLKFPAKDTTYRLHSRKELFVCRNY